MCCSKRFRKGLAERLGDVVLVVAAPAAAGFVVCPDEVEDAAFGRQAHLESVERSAAPLEGRGLSLGALDVAGDLGFEEGDGGFVCCGAVGCEGESGGGDEGGEDRKEAGVVAQYCRHVRAWSARASVVAVGRGYAGWG